MDCRAKYNGIKEDMLEGRSAHCAQQPQLDVILIRHSFDTWIEEEQEEHLSREIQEEHLKREIQEEYLRSRGALERTLLLL